MEKKHSSHQKHSRPAFHGILSSMMLVLLIEIILMMTVLYFSSSIRTPWPFYKSR